MVKKKLKCKIGGNSPANVKSYMIRLAGSKGEADVGLLCLKARHYRNTTITDRPLRQPSPCQPKNSWKCLFYLLIAIEWSRLANISSTGPRAVVVCRLMGPYEGTNSPMTDLSGNCPTRESRMNDVLLSRSNLVIFVKDNEHPYMRGAREIEQYLV